MERGHDKLENTMWRNALLTLTLALLLAAPVFADDDSGEKQAAETKADSIEWLTFPEGLERGKAEDKHVLIDFTASWCGWCKKMDKTTFADSAVIAEINENFVPVKVWGDSDDMLEIDGYKISEKQLAVSEFNVRGYPAFWFISPEGQKIGPLPGYQPAEQFMKALDFVSTREYEKQDTKSGDGDK
ncbi:DUF255 domain-containing protein [candidate division GN15 bacterium]|nr:DUF255 domain-containing protein [candidate division GN15 bacterium]